MIVLSSQIVAIAVDRILSEDDSRDFIVTA